MGNLAVGVRGAFMAGWYGKIAALLTPIINKGGEAIPDTGGVSFYNASGGTLAAGALVYLDGIDSTSGLFKAYSAQSGATGKQATWVVLESVASAGRGVAAKGGCIKTALNTSGAAIGDAVYLSTTAAGLTLTGSGMAQIVGEVATVATAGYVNFDLTREPKISSRIGRVSVLTAAGTSLTGSTSETVLASASIAANSIKAGTRVRIRAFLRCTAETGATTLTTRIRIGDTTLTGTAVYTSAATDNPAVGANQIIEFTFTGRAAPAAAASCVGNGIASVLAAAGAVAAVNFNAANFATNGALLVELTGQWSAADANAVQAETFEVDLLDA